jgi:Zn-dependent protease with chaperone function
MDISNFLNSYCGMYIVQSTFHALISAIIVDRAIQVWKINNPLVRQRFRLIIVLFPIFLFPIYQLINPDRGLIYFRMEALFDVNRWLNIELWGKIPLGFFLIAGLIITTAIFLFQEMIPVLKHTLESKKTESEIKNADDNPIVSRAIEHLPVKKPNIFILDDDDFVLFSTTGRNASIFLSTALIKALSLEQIRAAIAHEIAHIERSKRPLLLIIFLLRVLMFFNPVVLLEFRRAVQEEEKICDDIAVSLTRNPHALTETLKKLYYKTEESNPLQSVRLSNIKDSLEEYSHRSHIESRVNRLEQGLIQGTGGEWTKFVLTLLVIIFINYFVV